MYNPQSSWEWCRRIFTKMALSHFLGQSHFVITLCGEIVYLENNKKNKVFRFPLYAKRTHLKTTMLVPISRGCVAIQIVSMLCLFLKPRSGFVNWHCLFATQPPSMGWHWRSKRCGLVFLFVGNRPACSVVGVLYITPLQKMADLKIETCPTKIGLCRVEALQQTSTLQLFLQED